VLPGSIAGNFGAAVDAIFHIASRRNALADDC
jgi:hypothetical protein